MEFIVFSIDVGENWSYSNRRQCGHDRVKFQVATDIALLSTQSGSRNLKAFGSLVNGILFWLVKLCVRLWTVPVRQLQTELSLPPIKNPLSEGQHSPNLVLALFSQVFTPLTRLA